jgi:carbonic anhydrase/acetyltransferase-like protein (isoleucine patch superfamily)
MVIGENVLVAQRAYLENSVMGKGANAQENCYIINSRLKGNNVTAHGGKIIEADLEPNVFVGFNSFLRGRAASRLSVGRECVIMPHTIIDSDEPIAIPDGHLVWGFNTSQADIATNSVTLERLAQIKDRLHVGGMYFEGDGGAFVDGFRGRIHHILEANGAFFDGVSNSGHAQKNQNISFNTIQPYPHGEQEGLYPTIIIRP